MKKNSTRIETFILRKTDATSSNTLEAKKGKVEGHDRSKSKFSAHKGRYTMVDGMQV